MNNIKLLRGKRQLSQCTVARQLGVTPQAVSKWECEESMPSALLLPKLASILGCTIDELFVQEQDSQSSVREGGGR